MEGWKRIENYQFNLHKIIGQGSYATVYWGKSIENGESVAVKVIDKKLFLNAYNLKNIQSQIDIMKMVDHENIVKLYDIYQTTNNMYIITEFCEDGDLYHFLLQRRKFPQLEAKKYLKQVMRGAKYLHSNGIIHRDLKPANILIKKGICKISDFGFAKSVQEENAVMKSIVGTPLYMSPQILKHTKYTAKSDLWSIGLIYYQMLHGKTPWPANNELQLINGIYNKKPTFSKQVSQMSKSFILRCLEINQEDRIGWDQAFQHKLLQQPTLKATKIVKQPLHLDGKENFNMTSNRSKGDALELNKTNTSKVKKDTSEKVLKLENLTPTRKKTTKTPTNCNQTTGSMNKRIKAVMAMTPKKIESKTDKQSHLTDN